MGFLLRTLVTAFALWAATRLVPGIVVDGTTSLLLAALVFGLVNATVRPIARLVSLPLTILTLGLFLLVINAAMLALAAALVPGFQLASFWAAFLGAIVVGVVGGVATRLIGAAT